jgi:hypothetical protein
MKIAGGLAGLHVAPDDLGGSGVALEVMDGLVGLQMASRAAGKVLHLR